MNLARMTQAIAIANRANRLLMLNYQSDVNADPVIFEERVAKDEVGLSTLSNRACFAGYIAVSPEFKNAGGKMLYSGSPVFGSYKGAKAVAAWLDIGIEHANNLVFGTPTGQPESPLPDYFSDYYNNPMSDVTKTNVVQKLQLLITDHPDTVFIP